MEENKAAEYCAERVKPVVKSATFRWWDPFQKVPWFSDILGEFVKSIDFSTN